MVWYSYLFTFLYLHLIHIVIHKLTVLSIKLQLPFNEVKLSFLSQYKVSMAVEDIDEN